MSPGGRESWTEAGFPRLAGPSPRLAGNSGTEGGFPQLAGPCTRIVGNSGGCNSETRGCADTGGCNSETRGCAETGECNSETDGCAATSGCDGGTQAGLAGGPGAEHHIPDEGGAGLDSFGVEAALEGVDFDFGGGGDPLVEDPG